LGFIVIYLESQLILGKVARALDGNGRESLELVAFNPFLKVVLGTSTIVVGIQSLAMKWNVPQTILWIGGALFCAYTGANAAGFILILKMGF
jgi:hypothetical protein